MDIDSMEMRDICLNSGSSFSPSPSTALSKQFLYAIGGGGGGGGGCMAFCPHAPT